ncbi:MAG: hypothetical protein ACOYOK_02520 [Pseudobdellovibrionaceae bacterium]
MKCISLTTIKTLVIIFLTVFINQQSWSKTDPTGPLMGYGPSKKEEVIGASLEACLKRAAGDEQKEDRCNQRFGVADSYKSKCDSMAEEIKDAEKEINEACSQVGYGNSCFNRVLACDDDLVSEDFRGAGADELIRQIAGSVGMSASALTPLILNPKACPQLSGTDYRQEKKDLEELKSSIQESVDEAEEKKLKAEEDFTDLAKKSEEAKQEAQKTKDKEKQDAEKENVETTEALSKEKISIESQLFAKRAELSDLIFKKQSALIQLETGAQECMLQTQTYASKIAPSIKKGLSGYAGAGKTIKQQILDKYRQCLKTLKINQDRVLQQTREALNRTNKEIADSEEALSGISSKLTKAEENLKEKIKQSEGYLKSALEKEAAALAAQRMSALKNSQRLGIKQKNLQDRLSRIESEILLLGPVPQKGASKSVAEAKGTIRTQMANMREFKDSECCNPSLIAGSDSSRGLPPMCKRVNGYYKSYESSSRKAAK